MDASGAARECYNREEMKLPFSFSTMTMAVAIGVIVASTATLSFFSYHYTVGRENLAETSLVQSNIRLAAQYVDRIEQRIIDNDRILSEMVDVSEPSKWPAQVEAIKKADLNVEQVYFLYPTHAYPIYPPWSYEIRNSWGAFTAAFKVKELDIEHLAVNQSHHLHKERPDNYFFASYVLKESRNGDKILIVFQLGFEKILALLDKHLRDLQPNFYVSIVDFENNGIYNQPISRSSNYFYETRFPSTFYKWILQLVPRNYTEIERQLRNQRRTNLFLIILSMFLIFFSLAIISVAARRERQLRRLKEDFISNVSHELKTPLSLMSMFSEILKTGRIKSNETRREYYNIIHNECERMGRLIGNLLDFASLEQGGRARRFESINVAQLVAKELEAYAYQLQKDGFQLTADVDPHVPETLADPTAISMALFNLLDNSIKYSGEQKLVKVKVAQNNGYIALSVTDSGPGIPVEERQKIFEKFYRGSAAAAKKTRGSGIGLSLTKHVAEMHGGDILLQSEVGKGSTFILRIPIRKAPDLANDQSVQE
jgi:two-component system, OmpR family, phosphate regulon sensor histidine kinase PhoR